MLSRKNSLSRIVEFESGNEGVVIVGKGPDLLGRGAQKCDSPAALGTGGNLGGYSGVYVLNFLKSGRLVFCLVLFFGNLLVPA